MIEISKLRKFASYFVVVHLLLREVAQIVNYKFQLYAMKTAIVLYRVA